MLNREVSMWSLVALILSMPARADMLPLVEEDPCPPGSFNVMTHAYSYCAVTKAADLECEPGEAPTEVAVCVAASTFSCNSGRLPDEAPCSFEADAVFGSCTTDADCERGSCQPSRACIQSSSTRGDWSIRDGSRAGISGATTGRSKDEDDRDRDSSSCAYMTDRGSASLIAFLVGLLGLGLMRRLGAP